MTGKEALKVYIARLKERLKEKTNWGRNEIAEAIDDEAINMLLEEEV